jgi:hypothetical protein
MSSPYLSGSRPSAGSKKIEVVAHLSATENLRRNRGGWRRAICGIATRAEVEEVSVEQARQELCEDCHKGYLRQVDTRPFIVPFVIKA